MKKRLAFQADFQKIYDIETKKSHFKNLIEVKLFFY